VMHIDGISPEDIVSLEIPTGEPIHYSYEEGIISRDQ
jgi:bisphosphoglycerate-dependent phosphoglycerate mutase